MGLTVEGNGRQGAAVAAPDAAPPGALAGRLDDVVAAAIHLAPEALRRRSLLQAIDWAAVAPARVEAMLAGLAKSGQRPPLWLMRALLVAGHALPAAQALPRELEVLSRLNASAATPGARPGIAPADIEALCRQDGIDADVLRALVARAASAGLAAEACRLALAHWQQAPGALQAARAGLADHVAALPKVRLHVTAFTTTDVFCEDLKLACAAQGWQGHVTRSDFGEAVPTLLAPRADCDGHVLLLDAARLVERDWRLGSDAAEAAVRASADMLAGAIAAYADRTTLPLLVNTLAMPAIPTAGWRDGDHALGLRRAVDMVNERLLALAGRHACLHLIDADQALAEIAPARRGDAKLWYYGRIAYSAEASRTLAVGFAGALTAVRRGPAKVLALDLDNTLWGGVYGDDGIERLQCGEEAPGNAFQAFQRECLRLKGQGFLLVALSKNNADAIDVFERHPGMLLRRGDFTAAAIDWEPKPANIERLARELRLGLDSFVFLDDSPHEREAMRRLLPQVIVPEMPADPALRPEWLRRQQVTWPLRLTREDEARAELYAVEAAASSLKASAATLADYLASLEQRLDVAPMTPATLPRAAQMHQRTNQFNLTTRRSTESDLAALAAGDGTGLALVGRVRDKLGDHGITVAATATIDGREAQIETFLMSCRVIGREIERAFLGALLGELAKRGVARVVGRYIATPKNGLARDFYPANGFRPLAADGDSTVWEFSIGADAMPASRFVSVALES